MERNDDNDWIKYCTMMEADESRQRKTWWNGVKRDMKSFGLSRQDQNEQKRKVKATCARGNWPLKWCVSE